MASEHSELEVTNEEFNGIINNSSHKVVVVDFFADWCMPCLILGPIIEDLSKTMKNAKFAKIDIDDNQELAEKYRIHSIPCLIIFKNGKEIDRIIAEMISQVHSNYNLRNRAISNDAGRPSSVFIKVTTHKMNDQHKKVSIDVPKIKENKGQKWEPKKKVQF